MWGLGGAAARHAWRCHLEKAPAPVQRGAWPPHMLCRETGAFQPPSTAAATPPHELVSLLLSTLQSSSVCAPDPRNDGVPKTGCYAAGAFLPPSSASSEVPRGQGTLGHLPLQPSSASQPSTHGGCGSASEVAHGGTLRIPLLRPNSASAPVLPGGWRSILLNREAITPSTSATLGSPELLPPAAETCQRTRLARRLGPGGANQPPVPSLAASACRMAAAGSSADAVTGRAAGRVLKPGVRAAAGERGCSQTGGGRRESCRDCCIFREARPVCV